MCERQYFKILQFAALGRLDALALRMEVLEDFEAVPPAILFAGAKLRRQTEVLGLLLRADANVKEDEHRQGSARP